MKKKNTIALLMTTICLLALSTVPAKAQTCFSNKKEYDAVKDRLPPLLKRLPLLMTKDDGAASVALEIKNSGEAFTITGHVWALMSDPYKNSATIQKVCVNDGGEVRIQTNVGTKKVVVNGNSATFDGVMLTQNDRGYAGVLRKVQSRMTSSSSVAQTGSAGFR